AIGTAGVVVAIGVEEGILVAIVLSLLRHVRHSYRPHTTVLVPDAEGRWTLVAAKPGAQTEPGLIIYRFGADLFYANDHRFTDEVCALVAHAPTPVHAFIVEAGASPNIAYSAARSVRELLDDPALQNVSIYFARVSPYLRSDMDRHGITAAIGESRIFTALHEAIAAARSGARGRRSTNP